VSGGAGDDDLVHGSDDEPPRRRSVLLVAVLVVLGVAGYVAQRPDQPPPPPSAARPTASTPSGEQPDTGQQPWPTAASACGGTVELPLLSTAPLREKTGLTALVGGDGLRTVALDTGRVRRITVGTGAKVTQLAASARGASALSMHCGSVTSLGRGDVLTPRSSGRSWATAGRAEADQLVSGPDGTWSLRYPADPESHPALLRPLGGGAVVRLPLGFDVVAVTRTDFVGTLTTVDGSTPGDAVVAAVSRADPTRVRPLARGSAVAATDSFVLTLPSDCGSAATCAITRVDVADGSQRSYPLPPGRGPTSAAVLSPDGRMVAFQLSRTAPDPRFAVDHPFGPSDVFVLDLDTGRLTVVPGVELAPKTEAAMAFDPAARWLVLALDEGRRTTLLLWKPGLSQALRSRARLPGLVLYNAPVLAFSGPGR
jgi:hypothetical protein